MSGHLAYEEIEDHLAGADPSRWVPDHAAGCPACAHLLARVEEERLVIREAFDTPGHASRREPRLSWLPAVAAAGVLAVLISIVVRSGVETARPAGQDALADRVARIVERLRDEQPDVREKATTELRALWKDPGILEAIDAAVATLRDAEAAARARDTRRWIALRRVVPAGLIERRPNVVEAWLQGDGPARIRLLREIEDATWVRGEGDQRNRAGNAPEVLDAQAFLAAVSDAAWVKGLEVPEKIALLDIVRELDAGASAVPVLLLEDGAREVRAKATATLAHLGLDVDKLLAHPAAEIRLAALQRIATLYTQGGTKVAEHVKEVTALLGDTDATIRAAAARALGLEHVPDCADRIAALLDDGVPNVRLEAVAALGWLRAGKHAGKITGLLKSRDPRFVDAALFALGRMRATAAAPGISEHLKGGHKIQAMRALRAIRAREYEKEVAAQLADPDDDVRYEAALVLAAWGNTQGARSLVELLPGFEFYQRIAAGVALSAFRDSAAWQKFEALSDRAGSFDGFGFLDDKVIAEIRKRTGLSFERVDVEGGTTFAATGHLELADILTQAMAGVPVVESDRVRFLSEEAAVTFWQEWWAKREKR